MGVVAIRALELGALSGQDEWHPEVLAAIAAGAAAAVGISDMGPVQPRALRSAGLPSAVLTTKRWHKSRCVTSCRRPACRQCLLDSVIYAK